MPEQPDTSNDRSAEADRISRCLSMVLHHIEVQLMVDVIKELLDEQTQEAVAYKEM